MIDNGDFSDFKVSPQQLSVQPFADGQVCGNWIEVFRNPDINDKHTSNPGARLWHNYQNRIEVLGYNTQLTTNEEYFLSFKLKKRGLYNLPHEFRVSLFSANNLPYSHTGIPTHSSQQQVINVLRNEMDNNGNWVTYEVCFTANSNYDLVVFYPYATRYIPPVNGTYHNGWVVLDDVSLKELDLNLSNVHFDLFNNCSAELDIGSNCTFSGATYSWSPIDGLDDPTSPNPKLNVTPFMDEIYTVTVTLPGICSFTDQVHVKHNNIVPDNEDINWLKNNTPYTPATGGNPLKFSNQFFYIEGDLIIDQDVEFEDCNFYMDEDAKIIVDESMFNFVSTGTNGANFIKSCDPDKFWDGIYVDGINNNAGINLRGVVQNKIEFSNAFNGIVANNNPIVFNIDRIKFDRNNQAIYYEGIVNKSFSANIYSSEFSCSSPLAGGSGNYYPLQSVVIKNSKSSTDFFEISYGQASPGYSSIFNGNAGRLEIDNSNVDVFSAEFNGFNNQYIGAGLSRSNLAVNVNGISTASNLPEVSISGSYFNDNEVSINSNDLLNLEVSSSFVNQQGSSLATSNFLNVDENYDVEITGNFIYDVNRAFNIYNTFNVEVSYNTIDIETQSGGGYTSRSRNESVAIMIGNNIALNDYQQPPSIFVNNNVIRHSKVGIHTEHIYAIIKDNYVLDMNDNMTQPPCYFPPCIGGTIPKPFGIRAMNAAVVVEENFVENNSSLYTGNQPSSTTNMVGISIENAYGLGVVTSTANCNKVKDMGVGLRFMGNCGSDFEVYNNTMESHYRGFVLANYADIGDVGTPSKDANNRWTGSYSATGASHTFNVSYAHNPTHYVMSGGPAINTGDAATGFSVMTIASASGYNNDLICSRPLLTSENDDEGEQAQKEKVNLNQNKSGHALQSSTWTRRGQISDSAFNLNQQLLFRQLSMDSALYNSNQWKPFVDSMKNTVLGRSMNRNTNARASIQAVNNFDQNVQTLEPILHKIELDSILNSADSATLWQLANLCPYYDGIAVYQTRSILQQMGFPPIVNDCEVIKMPSSRYIRTKKLEANESVKLYPNPTEGTITVEYEVGEDENTTFELTDLLGKKQFSSRLSVGNSHQLNLSPMQSGLYIYRLSLNNEIVETGKLILQ